MKKDWIINMATIYSLLNKIGLTEDEVNTVIDLNPAVKNANPETVFNNLIAVSDAGFPDDELNWLCLNNANFLSYETSFLKNKIIAIKAKNPDFEFAIKNNPEIL